MTLLDQIKKCLKDERIIVQREWSIVNTGENFKSDPFCEINYWIAPRKGIYQLHSRSISNLNRLLHNVFGILLDCGTSNPFFKLNSNYDSFMQEAKTPPDHVFIRPYKSVRGDNFSVGYIQTSDTVGRYDRTETIHFQINSRYLHEFTEEEHHGNMEDKVEDIPLLRRTEIRLFPSIEFLKKYQQLFEGMHTREKADELNRIGHVYGSCEHELDIKKYNNYFGRNNSHVRQ